MTMHLQRGQLFPDLALPDHDDHRVKLSQEFATWFGARALL